MAFPVLKWTNVSLNTQLNESGVTHKQIKSIADQNLNPILHSNSSSVADQS